VAPLTLKYFVWKISLGKLPTSSELIKRGMHMSPSCSRCNQAPEDLDHVLWLCSKSKEVWDQVSSDLSIPSSYFQCSIEWINLLHGQVIGVGISKRFKKTQLLHAAWGI